ncbi:MAG: SLBB domain-containing protein [Candidatus Riflebacteria bacterium]|nr:SLBB domain-containing protein [Candidatus Riflebacteria bacterium]
MRVTEVKVGAARLPPRQSGQAALPPPVVQTVQGLKGSLVATIAANILRPIVDALPVAGATRRADEPGLATWIVLVGLAVVMTTAPVSPPASAGTMLSHQVQESGTSGPVDAHRRSQARGRTNEAAVTPFRVKIWGAVARPGWITVQPGSTAKSALVAAGGTVSDGTLRQVEMRRDGRLVRLVDFYQILLEGSRADPLLESGDELFVPQAGPTATAEGRLVRPGVFELLPGDTMEDLVRYAGGLEAGTASQLELQREDSESRWRTVARVAVEKGWEDLATQTGVTNRDRLLVR